MEAAGIAVVTLLVWIGAAFFACAVLGIVVFLLWFVGNLPFMMCGRGFTSACIFGVGLLMVVLAIILMAVGAYLTAEPKLEFDGRERK